MGGQPLKLDFGDGATVVRGFVNCLQSTGKWRHDKGNAWDKNHFISGSTLFAFQLEPDFTHHGEFLTLLNNANVRLDVQFKTGLKDKPLFN